VWNAVAGGVLFCSGLVAVAIVLERTRASSIARSRLFDTDSQRGEAGARAVSISSLTRRYRWVAVLVGIGVGITLAFVLNWPYAFAGAFAVLVTLLAWQVEEWWYQHRLHQAEQQLADSIDMLVAAVKSGSSLQGGLEAAMENSRRPWKLELQEVIGRIRYGDDPIEVLADLAERIPLETVRLFSQTLAVNWSVGGRLAQTLANVGKTIRDRIELSRRMYAMTTQARLSVISKW